MNPLAAETWNRNIAEEASRLIFAMETDLPAKYSSNGGRQLTLHYSALPFKSSFGKNAISHFMNMSVGMEMHILKR